MSCQLDSTQVYILCILVLIALRYSFKDYLEYKSKKMAKQIFDDMQKHIQRDLAKKAGQGSKKK